MYTHEYSDREFDSYDACRADFLENIEAEDITQYIDLTLPEIISEFMAGNLENFSVWLEEKIGEAINYAENELIFEDDD